MRGITWVRTGQTERQGGGMMREWLRNGRRECACACTFKSGATIGTWSRFTVPFEWTIRAKPFPYKDHSTLYFWNIRVSQGEKTRGLSCVQMSTVPLLNLNFYLFIFSIYSLFPFFSLYKEKRRRESRLSGHAHGNRVHRAVYKRQSRLVG